MMVDVADEASGCQRAASGNRAAALGSTSLGVIPGDARMGVGKGIQSG
jgi:hypothetical protein